MDYWSRRRSQALENCRRHEDSRVRDAYLRVATYCEALQIWCATHERPAQEDRLRAFAPERGGE